MQLIPDIPFGLAVCTANGETVTLTGLSDRQLRLRTYDAEPLLSLSVRFLKDDRASYRECPLDGWRVSREERTRLGVLRTVDVPCPAFASEARRALKLYADYLRLKALGDDEYLAHALTGCPYAEVTAHSFAEQKEAWLRGMGAFSLPGDWTLALTVDHFAAYKRFLDLPLDAFQRQATAGLPVFSRPAGRIYIGNACCPRLFPDRSLLSALLARAREQGLNVTVVLPPVSENAVPETERLLACLDVTNVDELCVNDLGALALARKTRLTPTLGIQLNRRRKDPRLPYQPGWRDALTNASLSAAPYTIGATASGTAAVPGTSVTARRDESSAETAVPGTRPSARRDESSAETAVPGSCMPARRGESSAETAVPGSCMPARRGESSAETAVPRSCLSTHRDESSAETAVPGTCLSARRDDSGTEADDSGTQVNSCSSERNNWRGTMGLLSRNALDDAGFPSAEADACGIQADSCSSERSNWKSAMGLLSRNALDDAGFREWLAELGVTRFEYEACGYLPSIAPGGHSLHLPFYQTNTSHACPLAAACLDLDPGQAVPDCHHICETHARLYPDELHMIGRYNSLFALDPSILANPARLSRFLASGIDRLVVNLLSL